jgi:hypothetical protein
MNQPKLPSRRGRKIAPMRYFDLSENNRAWLDAQVAAGMSKDSVARGAIDEFLYTIGEEEQERWIYKAAAEMSDDTSKTDIILNAALSRFIGAHAEEFASIKR